MAETTTEADAFAERLATDLMTMGGTPPNRRSDRLVLERKDMEMGGLCYVSLRYRIAKAYEMELKRRG